jgi:crotonobetainyl-CoA:carnitine CoA-transferase CaiB-like acyl-CoA transferase
LEGLIVAEISTSIAARFAGRLLADLGATVVALEAEQQSDRGPEGPVDVFLMANKRRAALELNAENLLRIRRRADVVLYDRSVSQDGALTDPKMNARSVVTIVTPYGMTGPHTKLHDDELLNFALSGIASTIPVGAEDRSYERPMQPYGHQAATVAGVVAAVAALQGWFAAERSGRGEVIDVAALDVLGSTLMGEVLNPLPNEHGIVTAKTTTAGSGSALKGFLKAKDGYVYVPGGSWETWAEILEKPSWLERPLSDPAYRARNWNEVMEHVGEALAEQSVDEVFRAAQARQIAAFPVNTPRKVVEQAQLRDRKVFQVIQNEGGQNRLAPRTPIRIFEGRGPRSTPDAVRAPGADTEFARECLLYGDVSERQVPSAHRALPLEGMRIADFSWVIAGPHSTQWMAALGAEVIKVESPNRPDPTRADRPSLQDSSEGSPHYLALNYSKMNCSLNLATPDGRALARRLAVASDIVVENYSTGAAERMGLDFNELSKEKPSLIMLSSSGLGRTGPDAAMRAYGTPIHSHSGHTYLSGWPGTPPRGQGVSWTDPITGEVASLAMLAALAYARRTGRGLQFDLSMIEITIALMFEPFLDHFEGAEPVPVGNRTSTCAPHNTFRCDDGWVAITAHTDAEWTRLADLTDQSHLRGLSLAERVARTDELDEALDDWCEFRTRLDVVTLLDEARVCAATVTELLDVAKLDQFQARGMLMDLESPGLGRYKVFKLPWVSDHHSEFRYFPAPKLGEHTDEKLRDVLGLSSEEISELKANHAIY